MRFNQLENWMSWIKTLHNKTIDFGLDRVLAVADRMNLLDVCYPVILVGGTNGKGSTVAGLESIYIQAGYKVGVFSTPYLLKVNEVIRISGKNITDDDFMRALTEVDLARGDISITPFEFTTLAALAAFKKEKLNVMILEVGMGGRLDAVNIMEPDISIVTSIQLDHVEFLGDTREKIGFEKAGIFRSDKPAICGDVNPPQSIVEQATKIGAKLFCINQDYGFEQHGKTWDWWSQQTRFEEIPMPKLLLQNMANVLFAVEKLQVKLPVSREAIDAAMRNVNLPGRMQVIAGNPTHLFDVSHNPAAIELLREFLTKSPIAGKNIAIFSMLNDKDIFSTLEIIKNEINVWYVAPLKTDRAADRARLADCFQKTGITTIKWFTAIPEAYKAALAVADKQDRVIVFGSFHTVEEVMVEREKKLL